MKNSDSPWRWLLPHLAVMTMLALLTGCAGQQSGGTAADTAAAPPPAPEEKPFAAETALNNSYANLVIADFTATAEIQRDYPDDLIACRESALAALVQTGNYRSVGMSTTDAKTGPTLVVNTHVPQMRIVGFNARFWGGAFAGNSEMLLEVTLTDQQTGTVMGHKAISSSVNVMGATWSFGASDRSLSTDMGAIMAAYIEAVVPGIAP